MGSTLLIMMVVMKEVGKRYHKFAFLRTLGPITACVIGLLTVIIGGVDNKGISVIGSIPAGESGLLACARRAALGASEARRRGPHGYRC